MPVLPVIAGAHVVRVVTALLAAALLATRASRTSRTSLGVWALAFAALALGTLAAAGASFSEAVWSRRALIALAVAGELAWLSWLIVGAREHALPGTAGPRLLWITVVSSAVAGLVAAALLTAGPFGTPVGGGRALTALLMAVPAVGAALVIGTARRSDLDPAQVVAAAAVLSWGIAQLAGIGSAAELWAVTAPGPGASLVVTLALVAAALAVVARTAGDPSTEAPVSPLPDTLTGLPRRRLFLERLHGTLTRVAGTGEHVAVLFLDLDRFKAINDSLGHAAGDVVLQTVAQRVQSVVPASCTVTRAGGDEFTILAPQVKDATEALAIGEAIRGAVRAPIPHEGRELSVGTSIGISVYPEDGVEPEMLLRHADAALYEAKERGRNTVQLCTPEMRTRVHDRATLEQELRSALPERQLELRYLPIIDCTTGGVLGLEAVVRWHHPTRGLLLPGDFLPLAEELGLMPAIGEWVIGDACRQLGEWRRREAPHLSLSVNLSLRELQSPDLTAVVARAVEAADLEPSALTLEVSERSLARGGESAVAAMRALGDLGVGLAVDDFGTGLSSLDALSRMPLAALKIDRSFVGAHRTNGLHGPVVGAAIAVAHRLGFQAIAEGVETEEELTALRAESCDAWQGFLRTEPVDASRWAEAVTSRS